MQQADGTFGEPRSGGHSAVAPGVRPPITQVDFERTPFTVAWEVTRACALACAHCRAMAQRRRDPLELSTKAAFRVVDQVVEIGGPILVVTGGDPLMRPDVFEIMAYALSRGLRVALSPSATKLVTAQTLQRCANLGVSRIHISLDGPDAETHDAFRGMRGSYQRTIDILADARAAGLGVQVGTTVSRHNIATLPRIAERVGESDAVMWSVFMLVPTGRAKLEDMVSAQEHEDVFNWLYDLSKTAPFDIRTTAGMHYRRVVIQRRAAERRGGAGFLTGAGYSYTEGMERSAKGVNDGNGFAFIDHRGYVYPSGFLQVSAGNVLQRSLAQIYRASPLFRDLRDPARLRGRCGVCEFRPVCGGSRARAYAVTGDMFAEEPCCVYQPRALREAERC